MAPTRLKILAIMPVRNEDDIVYWAVKRLTDQGIDVLMLDNYSTDASAADAANAGATIKAFGKPERFSEHEMNDAILREARNSDADWIITHAADEIYCSPVAGESYRAFIERTDAAGFNCINHQSQQYSPVDESFKRGDLEPHFKHWVTEESLGFFGFRQERTFVRRPDLRTDTCLHTITFEGKTVSPEEGIRKHYPIRSTTQGLRKLFTERYGRSVDNTFVQYRRYLTDPTFIWDVANPLLHHDA